MNERWRMYWWVPSPKLLWIFLRNQKLMLLMCLFFRAPRIATDVDVLLHLLWHYYHHGHLHAKKQCCAKSCQQESAGWTLLFPLLQAFLLSFFYCTVRWPVTSPGDADIRPSVHLHCFPATDEPFKGSGRMVRKWCSDAFLKFALKLLWCRLRFGPC